MALIDRIKYDAPSDDAIVWKFPGEQIRLGAQLIVNESQEVVFFKGGKALDTFGAGTHTLASGNLPRPLPLRRLTVRLKASKAKALSFFLRLTYHIFADIL